MDADWLSHQFEASRPRLRALTYRMLGSYEEADDAVQETWLRVVQASTAEVENLGGWLTTIAARICLDKLRARKSRHESPSSTLPSDVHSNIDTAPGPEQEVLIAESIETALLAVLDHLVPAERVAFVLHDVFAVSFDEIGEIVGRTRLRSTSSAAASSRSMSSATPSILSNSTLCCSTSEVVTLLACCPS